MNFSVRRADLLTSLPKLVIVQLLTWYCFFLFSIGFLRFVFQLLNVSKSVNRLLNLLLFLCITKKVHTYSFLFFFFPKGS